MTITVSTVENKPKSKHNKHKIRVWRPKFNSKTLEHKTRLDVIYSFAEIGYKAFKNLMFVSEFGGVPDLKFENWFEAKGWLQNAGCFKEFKK